LAQVSARENPVWTVDPQSESAKTTMPIAVRYLVFCAFSLAAMAADWLQCEEADLYGGTPKDTPVQVPDEQTFITAMEALDVDELMEDMTKLLTNSQSCWPADFGNYVGLFSRLSWHAAGTYREADDVGGAGGGRMRFDPEASWPDNTNLDKARALLAPIKRKHGDGLSWADLIVLAGTHAMWHQGAPLTQFCFGRLDDPDGEKSKPLGPGPEQESVAPCTGEQGNCQERANETNLAPTTVGLIYVNPEGPLGEDGNQNPDPLGSAKEIRLVFGKMGHDDRATVALVGGGHAFGKTHGACSDKDFSNPAGLAPKEARAQSVSPWAGKCPAVGDGRKGMGASTWTSGFEGAWTLTPTRWSNEFFQLMLNMEDWEMWNGPGGHVQWRLKNNPNDPRMRLTADLALVADPEYRTWSELFARNLTALGEAFDDAWEELITSGSSWASSRRCEPFGPPPAAPEEMLDTDGDLRSWSSAWNVTLLALLVQALSACN